MSKKVLLNSKEIEIILHRLACQLIENHNDFSETVLIGLQPRGSFLAERLGKILSQIYLIKDINIGFLDITFYRDDFRRREEPLEATNTQINFLIENKNVVLIDDVLFSGRSVRAALTAIQSYGRPKNIELLVLIDRRFSRHLPIQPTYKGKQVDAINEEKVIVNWKELHTKDIIYIDNK
ncbi:MAG: Bifunctional protein pyrR [Flavobacterium sp. SCGC AAA160-P02]|nr:MAG: Bifunctional protein pyrR [Flavobacterium sp. SCGC AAA160-P02]